MKKNISNVIFTVVIFTIIAGVLLISSTKSNSYIPYSRSVYHPYEGFSDYNSNNSLKYSSIHKTANTDDDMNEMLIQKQNNKCEKPYGFNGLFCAPGVADNSIDLFSNVTSSLDCIGKSSELTGSMGGLCLDNNLMTLLRTRGGNQTAGNMQIGTN
jgi:hypothetical protein